MTSSVIASLYRIQCNTLKAAENYKFLNDIEYIHIHVSNYMNYRIDFVIVGTHYKIYPQSSDSSIVGFSVCM